MEKDNRILTIIKLELSGKLLKLEEELEKSINSNLSIDEKIKKIINLLNKISLTEKSIEKFNSMISTEFPDNKK